MRKLLAILVALALCLPAFAQEIDPEKGVFVLMNIPYSMFYEEETTVGAYDSVSSATKQKSRSMDYAGGSFHMTPDGAYITGIVFPVYVEDESWLAAYGGDEITDDSSVSITTTIDGVTSTTVYKGAEALFEAFPFSYYRLSEIPKVYKVLDGLNCHFGPFVGPVIYIEGDVEVIEDPYAKLALRVTGADEYLQSEHIRGLVLEEKEGERAGLEHLKNIWLKTTLGLNPEEDVYPAMAGKTLVGVEFYTLEAKYVVNCETELPAE